MQQQSAADRGSNARFALRTTTAEAHARLDGLYSRLDLGEPADYAAFLTSHAAAFLPIEAALDAAGAEGLIPGWRGTRRSNALASDLTALGVPLPTPVSAPAFASEAEVLGGLYVLEGSRLGAAVLIRSAAPGVPTGFLAPGNPAAWRTFTAKLEEGLSSPALQDAAAAAASKVFDVFERAAREHLGNRLD